MLPIILITFAGYVFSFFKKSDPKILADLIIYVTAPSLFILSLSTTKFAGQEILIIILTAIAVIFSAVGILWILRKRINIPLGLYLPTAFMNSSFIGFPIILMAYGMQGLARAVIYDVTNGLLIYSLGIYIASGKTGKWEVLKTPILYPAAIGILLNFFNIKLPESIGTTLAILGSATIPLALFMLGIRLGNIKITSLKLPIASSLIRAGFGMAIEKVRSNQIDSTIVSECLTRLFVHCQDDPFGITKRDCCGKFACPVHTENPLEILV